MEDNKTKKKGYEFENVLFFEKILPDKGLQHLEVEISRQNSYLTQIKKKIVEKVKKLGGKSVSNFKYGQRKLKTWDLVFSLKWDTESWFGENVF